MPFEFRVVVSIARLQKNLHKSSSSFYLSLISHRALSPYKRQFITLSEPFWHTNNDYPYNLFIIVEHYMWIAGIFYYLLIYIDLLRIILTIKIYTYWTFTYFRLNDINLFDLLLRNSLNVVWPDDWLTNNCLTFYDSNFGNAVFIYGFLNMIRDVLTINVRKEAITHDVLLQPLQKTKMIFVLNLRRSDE